MGKFYEQMKHTERSAFSWAADHASRPHTLAAYMDRLIQTEDTIEEIVKKTRSKSLELRHETMYTEGTIRAHIRYRLQQARRNSKAKR